MSLAFGALLPWLSGPREYAALRRAERLSLPALQRLQAERLARLLMQARDEVPYYRDLLPPVNVIATDPVAALLSLPILDKHTIRREGERLRSERPRPGLRRNTSGGSTGEPATFYQDTAYRRWGRATKALFDAWTGYRPGHRKAVLWAASRDLTAGRGVRRLAERMKNRTLLNAYCMDPATMDAHLEQLRAAPPAQLQVYAESGHELARHALRRGIRIQGIGSVLSSAGTLFPDMRDTIEEAFSAPVFNRYGSREVGDMACECERHRGLHVNPLTQFLEILDDEGRPAPPGTPGRVVVTSLTNHSMPLLRYAIGDLASWSRETCDCGREWPLLEGVWGRVTDHLRGANGAVVFGGWLRQLLYPEDWIGQYQWVQHAEDHLRLRLIPADNRSDSEREQSLRERLEPAIHQQLGASTRLDIERVGTIPPSASGKHLHVISELRENRR
ncbi:MULTISPECIES: phenylacetate--CoA ligase family protein [Thioalkalivibrio]|uniref:phenylacetate--CoA ligase family protein n=1 Tax=Thioalkalivibrio TaxID=106633 RepID=UPI00036EFB37|nr:MULTISPECIES: phenylacetate--CoA ligase family protein [Thioalkalivibrio]OOC48928.1 capsule biosynthesis protein CapK [Thioalkalivibrio versutus]